MNGVSLAEIWMMEAHTKMSGTGPQRRYINIEIRSAIYRLNQEEARALHRELGRMIKEIDSRANLDRAVAQRETPAT